MGDRAGSSPVTRMIHNSIATPEFLINTRVPGVVFLSISINIYLYIGEIRFGFKLIFYILDNRWVMVI